MKKKQLEILAPVGNEEMLRAAVYAGANAVYLGFAGFNARASAGNFTAETLREAVSFCHGRGVKVHVALNTTVYPHETKALAEAIRAIAGAGADAVIVQDLAVAALARQVAPGLCLHGSTQMSIHTLQGALQLAEMGFSRVILARELSRAEIAHITASCPIETEIFVHGALCMSVSGQCYMSAFLGGRSGNRGSCAGTCRLPFCASTPEEGKEYHHLSLKDNSLLKDLADIASLGVVSAKIEGRLRTPEYVAAAVSAARAARDGQEFDEELLKSVFSRSGFTRDYYEGKIGRDMFGVRTEQDSAASKAALPRLRELFRREFPAVGVTMCLTLEEEGAKLAIWDEDGNRVVVYSEAEPQPAKNDPAENLKKSLGKTGGTPFYATEIQLKSEGGPWYLPGSAVNELRRRGLEELLKKRETLHPLTLKEDVQLAPPRSAVPETQEKIGFFTSVEQIPESAWQQLDKLVIPIGEADKIVGVRRAKTLLELPRVQFGTLEEDTTRRVQATARAGYGGYVAHNAAHIHQCRGLTVYGGFGLNITNHISAREYAAMGMKGLTLLPEMTAADMAYVLPGVPTAAIAYGRMPLMITRACPLQNMTDCAHCSKRGTLTDRKQKHFPVRCGLGVRTIYNPVPIYMGDKQEALPVDALELYFTVENAEQVESILTRFEKRLPWEDEFTRGLYFKGTQSANDQVNRAVRQTLSAKEEP